MNAECAAFSISELRADYKNEWLILTPALRDNNNRVEVWDLVFHAEKKKDALEKLRKLRRAGLNNAILYWTHRAHCNIKVVGKEEDDEVMLPNEVAEFFRVYLGYAL